MFSRKGLFALLIIVTVFTRFVKMDWGDSYFFHPDEDNIASAVARLAPPNFNPNFFAYGQFPIYLGYFSLGLLHLHNTFSNSIYILRFWSALFSVLSIPLIYLITRSLFKKSNTPIIAVVLSIFHPGLIQLAHFGTTESLLIFLFLFGLHLSIKYTQQKHYYIFLLTSITSGLAISTKISSAIFLVPVMLSWFYVLIKTKKIASSVIWGFVFAYLLAVFICLFSPYNIIDFKDFISSMNYETSVATGAIRVFYTTQFLHTTPYLYSLLKIFPYVNGIPLYLFSLFGLTAILVKKTKNIKILIVIFSVLIYFAYYGQLYIKWTRFMSPIFFIFPVLASYFLSNISKKAISCLLIFVSIIPGILFLSQYFQPDVRLQASAWISNNVPENTTILSEGGNVVNIPVGNSHYDVRNFDFYTLDHNQTNTTSLASLLSDSNYIINPSRRVYANQKLPEFPQSQCYFQSLFSGKLGFVLVKEFNIENELIDGVYAEESWTVFDRPTVRIYKKTHPLSTDDYLDLIQCQK